jgi:hypothetical protein
VPVLGRLLFAKKRRRQVKGALRAAAICKSNAYTMQISEKKGNDAGEKRGDRAKGYL